MKYPKIAIIADALDNQKAGVHVYLRGLLDALYQIAQDKHILLIREKQADDYPGWKQIALPPSRHLMGRAKRIFIDLPTTIGSWGANIVFEPAHFGPFRLAPHIRRVTFIHDLTPLLFPQYHPLHSALLQKWFLPGIVRKADLLLCNSQHTKKDIQKHWPSVGSKTKIIYPGLDPFWRIPAQKESSGTPFILAVGTLEPRKNLGVLIQAFEKLKAKGWPGKLVLTGAQGWKKKMWSKYLDRSPVKKDITQTGYVSREELRGLYSQCALFVYPSKYEGFGLPIIEALAAGAQVICSSSSSLPEAGGNCARYFNPERVQDLYIQLKESLEKEHICSDAALGKHLEQFDWNRSAEKFLTLMQNLSDQ
ncbi:MAG TPA: glycosyltransferase family 1 protein [Saprospiraceae bacterium]|nr:glycosyltransferase family 1 protein [Saprospiraceae bacterium]